MRTPLPLDENVAAKLREETRRRSASFKKKVNTCLRRGLEARPDDGPATPFTVESRRMGLRPRFDLDDIGGLLDLLDGPSRQ